MPLGLPTCAQWLPDPAANLKLFAQEFPIAVGCWMMIGIVAASMSTSTGALLALSTVRTLCDACSASLVLLLMIEGYVGPTLFATDHSTTARRFLAVSDRSSVLHVRIDTHLYMQVLCHNVGSKILRWFLPRLRMSQAIMLLGVRASIPCWALLAAIIASVRNDTGQ